MVAVLSVADKLAAGRLIAIRKAPYFRSMITSLVPYETADVPTIGVTARMLLPYNPEWIGQRSQDEVGALYWHEVMHVVTDTAGRRGDRHPRKWNIATDIFINDQGRTGLRLTFPPGGMFPELFGFPPNLSADEYYSLITAMDDEALEKILGSGGDDDWDSGSCGSGAGNPQPWEPKDQGAAGARSESEAQQVRLRVADSLRAHASRPGAGRGDLPLGLDRWAQDMLRPAKVPWRSLLSRVVRRVVAYRPGAVDYSFSRISRRQGAVGFGVGCPVMPAMVQPVPDVVFVLDTSGSMSHAQLAAGLGEAVGVLNACGMREIEFISCDHAVHAHGRVATPANFARLVKGGGGSSFVPAFDHIARMRPRPSIAIFATDGAIGVPPTCPPWLSVIWLLIDAGPSADKMPTTAYGHHVVVDDA